MRLADTNVLLYAVSQAAEERGKASIALGLLDADDIALSVQVLQEFYVQATRATRRDRLSHDQASLFVESWLRFPVQDLTLAIMQAGVATAARFQISYWDAAIVEAARAAGCRVVLTEDLGDGQEFAGVRIENPFRKARPAGPSRRAPVRRRR